MLPHEQQATRREILSIGRFIGSKFFSVKEKKMWVARTKRMRIAKEKTGRKICCDKIQEE